MILNGAGGRSRTGTSLRKPDFESGASTNSTTPAGVSCLEELLFYAFHKRKSSKTNANSALRIFSANDILLRMKITPPTRGLSELLVDLKNHNTTPQMTLKSLLEAFHERGFGFFLFIFALPAALPVPAFGLNTIIALPLLLLTAQQAIGRHTVWLPEKWAKKTLSKEMIDNFITKATPWVKRLEIFIRPRLSIVTKGHMSKIIGLTGFLMAVAVSVPLPLTNTVPSFGIALMAIGVLIRDGLAVMAGMIIGLAWVIILVLFVVIYGPEGFDLIKDFIKGMLP